MANTSLTLNYDAFLSTTLFNYHRTLEDEISTANAFLYTLMKGEGSDAYQEVDDLGDRMQIPLMKELGQADAYSGYDQLNVDPMDGITSAFFEWRQMAVPITISGLEEKKNAGEARIIDLLKAKTKQAVLGIQEKFAKALIQGNLVNGGNAYDPYVSVSNGALFVDPLFKLVNKAGTGTVGSVDASVETWWKNQFKSSSASTYAAFLKELRNFRNNCSKGPGGAPDLHIVDQNTYELYESALAAAHRNPSYQVADIPFDNVAFYRAPVTWDQFMIDVQNYTTTITKGTWLSLNSKFWYVKVHRGTNWMPTEFQKPVGQDAKTAHILWLGGVGVSNRRKHGVMFNIDITIAA